jgi:hypothetical protein
MTNTVNYAVLWISPGTLRVIGWGTTEDGSTGWTDANAAWHYMPEDDAQALLAGLEARFDHWPGHAELSAPERS